MSGILLVSNQRRNESDGLRRPLHQLHEPRVVPQRIERGIQPEDALRDNDSLEVFLAAGGAVITGPTGTNVNDIFFAYRAPESSDT